MRIVVTGAAGYVGVRLVERLVREGHTVIAVDRFHFGRDGLPADPAVRWVDADVRDVGALPLDRADAVIPLAAASSEASAAAERRHAVDIGVVARERLAHAAERAGVRRFVLPSSSNVYGTAAGALDETARTDAGGSVYAATCLEAERRVLGLTGGRMAVVVLRKGTLYGWSEKIRFDTVVNNFVRRACAGQALRIVGDGTQRRPFLHVDDAVEVYVRALHAPRSAVDAEIFNAADSSVGHTVNDVARAVGRRIGDTGVEQTGPIDTMDHAMDVGKLHRAFSWRPGRSLDDGVDDVAAGIAHHPGIDEDPRTDRAGWLQQIGGFGEAGGSRIDSRATLRIRDPGE